MNKLLKYAIFAFFAIVGAALFYNKVYVVKSTFEIIKPTTGNLLVNVRGIGNINAKDIYEITSQSGGMIEHIYFDEGEWVKKGDLLFTIDPLDLPMLQEEAHAVFEKTHTQKNALMSTKEALLAQKSLLKLTHERYKKLLAQKFVTQAEYDKSKSELSTIDAQIATMDAEISSAEFEVIKAEKSIAALHAKRSVLNVYAPIDGYITLKNAQKAQYILPSQSVFKIVDATTLWVEANVDERVAKNISLGYPATIKLRSSQKIFHAKVKRIFAQSNLVTLERKVAVAFDEIPEPFYINEQAEVNITSAKYENVLKIPLGLLQSRDAKVGVWIAKGDEAYFSEVEVLGKSDEEAAISKGLSKEDMLLVPAKDKKPLMDGMRIFR
ncbi:MAG: efflux RND transporter periplasmic adaptor subunit [Sulfurimonas sp.]|nr:efflux RND transporter periplasmic adaptor subunit [Sulfurimonas sp.]MDD5203754.1 efflux RND transporter periplasmic adaptor subunit [Sulfurimonas sp.]